MDYVHSISGMVETEITGADIPATLMALSRAGISLQSVIVRTDLTAAVTVSRSDYRRLKDICEKRGDSLQLLKRQGAYWRWKRFGQRPVLVMGLLFFLFWMLYLPTRVLFFQVEGNEQISDKQILEAAEKCGISFGASRRDVRSERMKNALLQELPQLQWAGINTYGCVGVISVRERSVSEEKTDTAAFGNIVASRDGIVLSCTATKGTLCCQPGQAVLQGQILISGYTDCGLVIQSTGASGEIYGTTNRKIEAVIPAQFGLKSHETAKIKQYSLIVGKNRIKLWKDSGIWDSSCGRIYSEKYITLPGGFVLPFGWSVDTWILGSVSGQSAENCEDYLRSFANNYVCSQMIAGSIETESVHIELDGDLYRLEGEYVCNELIGKWQAEQIGEANGKSSRENR